MNTPHVHAAGLRMPGAQLFTAGHEEMPAVEAALPFIEVDADGREKSLWHEPTWEGSRDSQLKEQADWGMRAAAAWMIFLQQNGTEAAPDLFAIRKDQPNDSYAVTNFWSYLQRLLWQFGTRVSTADIAADVEECIRRDAEADQFSALTLEPDTHATQPIPDSSSGITAQGTARSQFAQRSASIQDESRVDPKDDEYDSERCLQNARVDIAVGLAIAACWEEQDHRPGGTEERIFATLVAFDHDDRYAALARPLAEYLDLDIQHEGINFELRLFSARIFCAGRASAMPLAQTSRGFFGTKAAAPR